MRLNLGCCDLPLSGWTNVDKSTSSHIKSDVTADALKLDEVFDEGTIDEIYAGHLLEHLTPEEADLAMEHWKKMLKKGGKLCLVTPDFKRVCEMYLSGKIDIFEAESPYIFSYQQESVHRSLWDIKRLKKLFDEHGFSDVIEIDRMSDPRLAFGVDWQVGVEGICNS